MAQMKTTILVSALAAASLLAAGCEQRPASGDKVGQATNPDKPALMAQNDLANKADKAMDATGKAMDDTMITAKVKAALLAEPGLKSAQIDVATNDATVTLTGSVASDSVRDRAKQIAQATEGVKDVVDNLNLKTTS